jgi:hypothetical protein
MPTAHLPCGPAARDAGVACRRCGGVEFTTAWQLFSDGTKHLRMACARCRAFLRWVKQDGSEPIPRYARAPVGSSQPQLAAPVPATGWHWLGFIRQSDQVWRPVAYAETPAACWEAMLAYPGHGEILLCPTRPIQRPNANMEVVADEDDY